MLKRIETKFATAVITFFATTILLLISLALNQAGMLSFIFVMVSFVLFGFGLAWLVAVGEEDNQLRGEFSK